MTEIEVSDLGQSLIQTLFRSELPDITQDIAEVALDSFLSEGVFREVPIVDTIVRLGKTYATIRDYFLLKKVLRFLGTVKEQTTHSERDAFAETLDADENYGRRVGETLLVLLDRYDHIDKSRLMALLFSGYLRQEIDHDDFFRLSTAIDHAFIADLYTMLDYFAGKIPTEGPVASRVARNLYVSNLSDFYILTEEQARQSGLDHPRIYGFNRLAKQMAKIILRDRLHPDFE